MSKGPVEEFTVGGGELDWNPDAEGVNVRPARRPWRAPMAWASCAVVLILIGVLTAPPRPSDVGPWGRVDDLTTEPQSAWSIGAAGDEFRSALIADGMLITVRESEIQGRDPSTGQVQWAEEADAARCTSDGTALVCVDADSRVLELDAGTGAATAQEIPDAVLATRAEGDLFVLTAGERPALQRLSGEQTVWSTRVHLDRGSAPFGVELTVLAGHVLTTRATAAAGPRDGHGSAYDAATGEWLAEGAPHNVTPAGTGAWQLMGSDGGQLFVRGADQPQQLAQVALGYDDAWTGPDQVAITGAESSGVDAGSGVGAAGAVQTGVLDIGRGEWRWATEQPMAPVARLDGVLIAQTSANDLSATQGRDVATGEVLWDRSETWLRCPCLADEDTLMAVEVGFAPATLTRSGGYEDLIALDARTGQLRWEQDLPGEMFAVLSDGEHLIVVAPAVVQGWDLG